MACASLSDPLRAIDNMGRGIALTQIEEKPSSSQDGRRVLGQRDAEFKEWKFKVRPRLKILASQNKISLHHDDFCKFLSNRSWYVSAVKTNHLIKKMWLIQPYENSLIKFLINVNLVVGPTPIWAKFKNTPCTRKKYIYFDLLRFILTSNFSPSQAFGYLREEFIFEILNNKPLHKCKNSLNFTPTKVMPFNKSYHGKKKNKTIQRILQRACEVLGHEPLTQRMGNWV